MLKFLRKKIHKEKLTPPSIEEPKRRDDPNGRREFFRNTKKLGYTNAKEIFLRRNPSEDPEKAEYYSHTHNSSTYHPIHNPKPKTTKSERKLVDRPYNRVFNPYGGNQGIKTRITEEDHENQQKKIQQYKTRSALKKYIVDPSKDTKSVSTKRNKADRIRRDQQTASREGMELLYKKITNNIKDDDTNKALKDFFDQAWKNRNDPNKDKVRKTAKKKYLEALNKKSQDFHASKRSIY